VPGLLRRAPRPLLVLLAVAAVEAVAWSIVLPPLQGPDEISHVAYVQRLVESRSIPWQHGGAKDDSKPPYSTELTTGAATAGTFELDGNPAARPNDTAADEALWDQSQEGFGRAQRANGGFRSAMKNPPAYYLYSGLVYTATSPLDLFDQLFLMRLANIPLLLAMVVFTWLLAGELLPRRRALQTLAAAVVALQPQLIQLTANVNPDVLLAATSTAGLYLSVVILQRGLSAPRVAGLVSLCVLAGFTHGRGLALVVPALLALALRLWKDRRPDGRPVAVTAGALALGAVASLAALVFVATNQSPSPTEVRRLFSYVWQFYLPRLGFMSPPLGRQDYGIREVMTERFYGAFAQLEVHFPAGFYDALWVAMGVVAIGAFAALLVHRRAVAARWDVAVVLAGAVVGLLGLLHTVAFRSLLSNEADPIIAGRYLLPVAALFGIAVALAVSLFPRRWGAAAGGAVVATLALVQVAALGITLERFYA
jgi:4-amino-4-deoxy-L-arabinose transferase-like glycosyltransferase